MLTNLPNLLTLSRIGAIPLLIATFYLESPYGNWIGLGVLTYAGVTDFFDGYVARAWEQQSQLGKFLDPIADKLLVGSLLVMLVAFDRIPGLAVLPAVVILCREILVSGLREFLAGVKMGVPVSKLAQWKTALQMLMLGFLLVGPAGPMFGPFSTTDIGVAGLWLAAILTLITGYDYLRAGLRHVDDMDSAAAMAKREQSAPAPAGKTAADSG
jgi:cardiolipin synthase